MKEKFEIEEFMLEIKEATDILKCFDDFCDESILPKAATQEEREINAQCFIKRLKTHRALLNVAIKVLEQSVRLLAQKFNL